MGRWLASVKQTNRPIAVVGPSGVGKSHIGYHIEGKTPQVSGMSTKVERRQLVAEGRGTAVWIPPGTEIQATGKSHIFDRFISDHPPKVICMVVAGGFHATDDDPFINNFKRPGSHGKEVATNVTGFVEYCEKEEIKYLKTLTEAIKNKVSLRIPAVITIVNKKDMWMARRDHKKARERYKNKDSDYGKAISTLCRTVGFNQPAIHEVFPMYSEPGGFLPHPMGAFPFCARGNPVFLGYSGVEAVASACERMFCGGHAQFVRPSRDFSWRSSASRWSQRLVNT